MYELKQFVIEHNLLETSQLVSVDPDSSKIKSILIGELKNNFYILEFHLDTILYHLFFVYKSFDLDQMIDDLHHSFEMLQ
jgi:hypothetical protein